jgi:hypothetical protein
MPEKWFLAKKFSFSSRLFSFSPQGWRQSFEYQTSGSFRMRTRVEINPLGFWALRHVANFTRHCDISGLWMLKIETCFAPFAEICYEALQMSWNFNARRLEQLRIWVIKTILAFVMRNDGSFSGDFSIQLAVYITDQSDEIIDIEK